MWAGIYVIAASMLWSTIGVAVLLSSDVIAMLITRSLLIALVGLAFFRSLSRASVLSGTVLGVLFISYTVSVILTGVGPAAYLLYTAPLWSSLIALKYGERISSTSLLGMALVLISVFLMYLESLVSSTVSFYGLLLGLLTGLIYGSYISIVRYFSSKGFDKEVSLGAMPYVSLVVLPLILYYLMNPNTQGVVNSVVAGSYLAVFCTLIPYRLFAKGAKYLKASTTSVIASIEPVFASVWDYLIFGRTPTELLLTAYVLMTLALLLVSVKK